MVSPGNRTEGSLPSVVSVDGLPKDDLLAALSGQGVHLNQAAKDLFSDDRFKPNSQATEIQIELMSVSDLGFEGGATYAQIVARALKLGLSECPLELAPYLRLQYLDQPVADSKPPSAEPGSPPGAITVASKPLDVSDETPKGFYLRNIDGTLWLRGYWSDAIHVWSGDDVLVFSLNKA